MPLALRNAGPSGRLVGALLPRTLPGLQQLDGRRRLRDRGRVEQHGHGLGVANDMPQDG